MTAKQIIVEGPDGSGKSTLIKRLSTTLDLPVHPKFSGPEGPDLTTLHIRTQRDLELMAVGEEFKSPGIYDRYPLISEWIYGPIIRGSLTGWFNDPEWIELGHKILRSKTVVVWCLPPLSTLYQAVSDERDMAGVRQNLDAINLCYMEMAEGWRGPKVIYDYTRHGLRSLTKFLSPFINPQL